MPRPPAPSTMERENPMDRYEDLKEIGAGSFGTVYVCRIRNTERLVALKKISTRGKHAQEIESLRQECEIQKNFKHPNIIRMLDAFNTNDAVVVVTEYAREDLARRKERAEGKCLPIEEVQHIACHIVSALYFLHSHRILHRDIKPQNILLGWDGMAKLCDFGFAKALAPSDYMLTSVKGTPLYMAPEIVNEKPYDHNADLWSLGCILYELLIGKPPFLTNNIIDLVQKVRTESIDWPEKITGHCLSFLQGLLEKNPQKRLTWPSLLSHAFVRDGLYIENTNDDFSLTKVLSPSQELAKETQRQHLERKLQGYSKLLRKTARKLEEAQKQLKRCTEDGKMGIKTPLPSPNGLPASRMTTATLPLLSPHHHAAIGVQHMNHVRLHSPTDARNLKVMFQNMKLKDGVAVAAQKDAKQVKEGRLNADEEPRRNSNSSCETMTSSSEFETGSDDESDEADTVILENLKKREGKRRSSPTAGKSEDINNGLGVFDPSGSGKPPSRGGSGVLWKSGALFTLHSFGSEDKPINSDEWIYFLKTTMKEVLDNPKSLCEKHFLTMLVAPLRNHLAEAEVVEKIAVLLSLPYTLDKSVHEQEPGLMSSLQTLYLDTKVLPNLLYSCKLIVRRRRVERSSVTLDDILKILTVEDLEGLEKCLRLVVFLVHSDEDFVTQLCDSVCVLQVFSILQLFIKLDCVRSRLAADTIAILCHILRTIPANKNIVEEILLDETDKDAPETHIELWRLISHQNPIIQARSLRVFTYLCLNSERVKTEILNKSRSRVWKVLRRAAISPDVGVRETAEFALQVLNYKSMASERSISTVNSGCQSQDCLIAIAPSIPYDSHEGKKEGSLKQRSVDSPLNEETQVIPELSSIHSGPLDDTSR